jgi:hypothetical protein
VVDLPSAGGDSTFGGKGVVGRGGGGTPGRGGSEAASIGTSVGAKSDTALLAFSTGILFVIRSIVFEGSDTALGDEVLEEVWHRAAGLEENVD